MKNKIEILRLILILTAIHSFVVGMLLISLPSNIIELFGYSADSERFFRTQGGVFHIVMALGYWMASRDILNSQVLIKFIILVKLIATAFLLIYYFFVTSLFIIISSGIVDLIIGIIIYIANTSAIISINSKNKD